MKRKAYTRRRRTPDSKVLRIGDYVAVTGRNRLSWGVNIWLQDCAGGRFYGSGSSDYVRGEVGFDSPQHALQWARAMIMTGAL